MSKKSVFILLMVFIVLILGIYIYPSIKNDNYQKRLISDIYKNTDIKDIEYLNKDNNYYVVKDRDKVIVLDLNYEEVYSIDKSKLKDNDLDLVYRRNNLYYEEKTCISTGSYDVLCDAGSMRRKQSGREYSHSAD